MERIKDFLYDISDLLISLLIIAAIFAVISWKLNESLPIDTSGQDLAAETPAATEPDPGDGGADPGVEPATVPADDASDADKPIDEAPKPPTEAPTTEAPPAPEAGKAVTVEVPSGSTGYAIGKLLKDKALITDVNVFIQKVDEMGLGPKLRSGTFQLKTGMSLEEIIKILANVK